MYILIVTTFKFVSILEKFYTMTTHIRVPDSEYDIGFLVRSKMTELIFDTHDSMPTGNSATELTREVKI